MKNFKLLNLLILFVSFNIIAQEPVELTDDEIRTNEINELLELVKKNKNLIMLTSDVSTSAGLDRFKSHYKNNYLEIGISEQNMIPEFTKAKYKGFIPA